jgi:hypothetical protein
MLKSLLACLILLLSPAITIFAQDNAGRGSIKYFNQDNQNRELLIEETLRKLSMELTLEYFTGRGTQSFQVGQESLWRSKLKYPRKGGMLIYGAEIKYLPFSIGGSYGHSYFKRANSTDTDWRLDILPDVWWESNSSCKPLTEIWDINLYCRLLELKDKEGLRPEKKEILGMLRVDSIALDIFGGYQQEKGRYPDTDLVDTVEDWIPVPNIPIPGEDSFFKIKYRGPRLGVRVEGSKGRFSSRISFAYAWLEAEGFGWWNIRRREFLLRSGDGYGINFDLEVLYNPFADLFLGVGYKYMYSKTTGGRYSGVDSGVPVFDLDAWQDSESLLSGAIFIVRYLF